jgi:hypothetical protein
VQSTNQAVEIELAVYGKGLKSAKLTINSEIALEK